ncbi:hypothetical protein HCN44_005624 [Aphidius gifuensis]|uniref:Non-canonical purine NTP phosphatase/PRRC1 domain-containing protein n=2 Tax=Aphidius gifuensis TaxID=684658 RepID=A0A834Y3Z7_APHGI|nr:protein PRRC1-like isoform X1 [Aphidius gifuensis]KAF7997347.1 hypothetical protein HCN44_005624 [Aphidius gifuensis]
MNDESNGESTFEFVDKRVEEMTITGDLTKNDSSSNMSSSSTGNLLSNIAPPSALPSFIANPVQIASSSTSSTANDDKSNSQIDHSADVQTKQPQDNQQIQQPAGPSETVSEKLSRSSSQDSNQFFDAGLVGSNLFSWVKTNVVNSNVLSKVAEKAKSSVNTMITTLDPQMREFIYSGGDCKIIVATNEEGKISPVREAFQSVFGKATVSGMSVDTAAVPKTPIGFAAAVKSAESQIKLAKYSHDIPDDIPIIAVQNFIHEIDDDKWYELAVILMEDKKNNVNLQTFSQMTPVPSQFVEIAKTETPDDYPLITLGLAISIDELMADNLQVSKNEWHHALTGVSRRDSLLLAAQSLAGIYKNTIAIV